MPTRSPIDRLVSFRYPAHWREPLHHDQVGRQDVGVGRAPLPLAAGDERGRRPAGDEVARAEAHTAKTVHGDVAADAVVDHVDAPAPGQPLRLGGEVLLGVEDDLVRSGRAGEPH